MRMTEELRGLLDDRGVEWTQSAGPFPQTDWEVDGVTWHAKELERGLDVSTRYLVPHQVVDATLGAGTCRMTPVGCKLDIRRCSGCGMDIYCEGLTTLRHCPSCGRTVVK